MVSEVLNGGRLGYATLGQAANFFRLSISDVERRASTGEWPSYFIGEDWLFDLDEVVALLAKRSEANK